SLITKPFATRFVPGGVGELQCNIALQLLVEGAEDDAHTTPPDLFYDPVAAERCADRWHCRHRVTSRTTGLVGRNALDQQSANSSEFYAVWKGWQEGQANKTEMGIPSLVLRYK